MWNELNEDQAIYDQYNKVPGIDTAVVAYVNDQPAASGCFKKYNDDTVEIKGCLLKRNIVAKAFQKLF